MHFKLPFLLFFCSVVANNCESQTITNKKNGGFIFTPEKEINYTAVKNQYKSSMAAGALYLLGEFCRDT